MGKEHGIIAVRGYASSKHKPDTVEFSLTVNSKDKDYAKSVKLTVESSNRLKESLSANGVDISGMIDNGIYTDVSEEYVTDKHGNSKRVKTGYSSTIDLRLSLPLDETIAGKVITASHSSGCNPSIEMNYSLSKSRALSMELIPLAVADAKEKAMALAAAAGVKLEDVEYISHDNDLAYEGNSSYSVLRSYESAEYEGEYFPPFVSNPSEIELSEEVNVRWRVD